MATPPLPESARKLAEAALLDPLRFFVPTGKQRDFLALTSFVQGFSGGNWSGKTVALIAKLAALVWPQDYAHNPHLALQLPKHWPLGGHLRGRWFTPHTVAETDLIPSLEAWLPKGRYTASKAGRPFESQWRLMRWPNDKRPVNTRCAFDILTYDQDPEEAEGVKLDWAAFNEPPPEALFNATIARMKPHAVILLGMTPLTGAGYLFDRLEARLAGKSWQFVTADIESACLEHGDRGFLPHGAIARKIEEYDPEEREARIHGRPMHLSGLVYKEWTRELHVVPERVIPADWTRWLGVDPHDRKPYACLWLAVDPSNHLWVYDEFPNEPYHELRSNPYRPADYLDIFKGKEAQTGGEATWRVMDARFGPRAEHQGGQSLLETFDELDMAFEASYKDAGGSIDVGHQAVRTWLAPCGCGQSPPHPRLRVLASCRNLIRAMERYCWDDYRHRDGRSLKEKPKDEYKDFADVLRYLCMEDPRSLAAPVPESPETSTSRWVRERESELTHA